MNACSSLVSLLNVHLNRGVHDVGLFRAGRPARLLLTGQNDLPSKARGKALLRYGAGFVAYVVVLGLTGAPQPVLWATAAVFVAAFTSSIAGFAFSAICGAMLFHLFDDPIKVVTVMMVCSIAGQVMMVWSVRREICWRSLAPFLVGGVLGLPLGVHLLLHSRPGICLPIIGLLLVCYATFMLFRRPVVLRQQHVVWDGLVGFFGGVTGGVAAFPGAFVTIWCGFKGWNKERQRSLYQPFILFVQIAGLALLTAVRLESPAQGLRLDGLEFVPATLLGTSCGLICFHWLNDRQFARVVNVLLVVSGLTFLV